MKAEVKAIVRGEGRIYVNVALSIDGDLCDSKAIATNEQGVVLPSEWYSFESSDNPNGHVAVIPFLLSGYVYLAISTFDNDGNREECTLRISMSRAKWASRINYFFRKQTAFLLRNSNEQDLYQRVNFWFSDAIRNHEEDDLIVHGMAWYAQNDELEFRFVFFDERGERVAWEPILLGKDKHPYRNDSSVIVQDVHFTICVPIGVRVFTVAAVDAKSSNVLGFCSLDPAYLEEVRSIGDSMLMDAGADNRYHDWFVQRRVDASRLQRQRKALFEHNIMFSIVVPLYNTPVELFDEMLESVLAQSYANWELVLVNASADDHELQQRVMYASNCDERVKHISLENNRGIAENTAAGIRESGGDYICFLDHDDIIEPDALYEYANVLSQKPKTDVLYCDEDKILADGKYANAFFKTDFNIDLLRCHNYICHFLCIKRSVLDSIDLPTSRFDGAQDHDLILKVSEVTNEIVHVCKVLYHWRVIQGSTASADQAGTVPKAFATDAGRLAIEEHLARLRIDADVLPTKWPYTHRVKYHVQGNPLVSIIIPNKDCKEMLSCCIESILRKTTYQSFEIIVVENNSIEAETFELYKQLIQKDKRIKVLHWSGDFNFSSIVNYGVAHSMGEYVLLLNNDTAVIEKEWLEDMLGICQRDDVGIVGAKLLYRDNTIQHAGAVIVDPIDVAHHCYMRLPNSHPGYFLQAALTMDYSIVTAACMMTKRSVFDAVDGFEEELTIAYNDVDYCLKVREKGLLVVYEPHAVLYHYESVSRGYDFASPAKKARAYKEAALVHYRWPEIFVKGDPFFNPNLESKYHKLRINTENNQ